MPAGQPDPRHEYVEAEPEAKREPSPSPAPAPRVVASHLRTTFRDPLLHQATPSLRAVRENATVPNRFRILVRVRELVGRGARGSRPGDLAVLWCAKCARAFADAHCRSCEDARYAHAELRWQLVLVLEDEAGGELVAALSGELARNRNRPER